MPIEKVVEPAWSDLVRVQSDSEVDTQRCVPCIRSEYSEHTCVQPWHFSLSTCRVVKNCIYFKKLYFYFYL